MRHMERSFKALADVNRLRIVNLLLRGELCGCDIQHALEAPQPNVSRHLTYLKNAGLVTDRREGTRIYYGLTGGDSEPVGKLFDYLRSVFEQDKALRADLARLKQAVQNGACSLGKEWGAGRRRPHVRPVAAR
jgi:ArsR family transcriptional regulator, arsenate/arsenite/antimonite-responsive transcriptional repressor